MSDTVSLLLADVEPDATAAIAPTLARFPAHLLRQAAEGGIRFRPLARGERYADASAMLRECNVDAWPIPPAGLFVISERTVYLRSLSPMTIAHEFGHALDCAIGGGVYASQSDEILRSCFAKAPAFVTNYAASAIDEYFAEGVRAMAEVNDASSPWTPVSRARLSAVDPSMYALLSALWVGP